MGTPFAWHKFRGGTALEWIGLWCDYTRFATGVSEKRGQWLIKTLRSWIASQPVVVRRLNEQICRFTFAFQGIEHLRPFLGPFYAWIASVPAGASLPLPKGLLVIAKFLESQLGGSLVEEVPAQGLETAHRHVILSGDAKAEGDDVMLGGWRPARDGSTTGAPWFRLRLTRRNAPWAFGAGEPFRRIASLELFTTLLCFMLLVTSDDLDSDLLLRLTSETDNLGNSHAVSKLMTTRFPLVAFLAELAVQVHSKRASLDVAWVPRMQNLESDELSNNLTRLRPADRSAG